MSLTLTDEQVEGLHKVLKAQFKLLDELKRSTELANSATEIIYDMLLRNTDAEAVPA